MSEVRTTVAMSVLVFTGVFALTHAQVRGQDRHSTKVIPQQSFFSSTHTVPIGMVDYGHHAVDSNQMEFLATHYDSFVSGDQTLNFGYYRSINQNIRMYCYFNSFMLAIDRPAPTAESAYLHDESPSSVQAVGPSSRLGKYFEGDFYYVMDPSSSQWQQYARAEIEAVMSRGFNGVLLDDVFAHLMHEGHFGEFEPLVVGSPDHHSTFSTTPAWYNPQTSHNRWRRFLAFMNQHLPGEIIFNGINDLWENQAPINSAWSSMDYLNVSDGSVQEGFVHNSSGGGNPADGFLGDEYWEATVEALMSVPPEKRDSVVSYGGVNNWSARVYSLASYLIGRSFQGNSTFYYAPDVFTMTWLPEWSLDLGLPSESYASLLEYKNNDHHVYIRRFAKAVVVVNPYGAPTGAIPLDRVYYSVEQQQPIEVIPLEGRSAVAIGDQQGLRFTPVSSIQLGPYSAVILMK